MSDFETVVNAIRDDLVGNIPRFSESKIHLYETWDPEELSAGPGETHLAIWPAAEEAETAEGLTNESHLLNQLYLIQVWQGAPQEASRIRRDEEATKSFLDLHNSVRDRFYKESNQTLGGSVLAWYRTTQFPDVIGTVRWFRLRVVCQRVSSFVP